jgi:hypothetical protein
MIADNSGTRTIPLTMCRTPWRTSHLFTSTQDLQDPITSTPEVIESMHWKYLYIYIIFCRFIINFKVSYIKINIILSGYFKYNNI